MDTGETTTDGGARSPATSSPEEPPYEGAVGQTRLETVHVTMPGGFLRSLEVYRAVNVATHPELREVTLAGALHSFDGGQALAIPFVFHDPAARKLALVLPEALRHRELSERAELLRALSEDTAHPVPPYARQAVVVIGIAELTEYLERPVGVDSVAAARRQQEADARAQAVAERAHGLAERESRLKARAEEVTRQEDEARILGAELETLRRRLTTRQRELESEVERLHRREAELGEWEAELASRGTAIEEREAEVTAREAEADAREAALAEREAPNDGVRERRPLEVSGVTLLEDEGDAEEVEEFEELEDLAPLETSGGVEIEGGVALPSEERPIEGAGAAQAPFEGAVLDSEVEELVDDDDVEELDDLESIREVTGAGAVPAEPVDELEERTLVARAEDVAPEGGGDQVEEGGIGPEEGGAGPEVPPPPVFWSARRPEMAAAFARGDVWLFVRAEPDVLTPLQAGHGELLVQLHSAAGHAVVLLTLVVGEGDDALVRRVPLDPARGEHRRVLEGLRSEFVARVAVYGPDDAYVDEARLEGEREVNAALVLERQHRLAPAGPVPLEVLDATLREPPPHRAEHPFREEGSTGPDASPDDAASVAAELRELVPWASAEGRDRALLELSIPRDVVDAWTRRVLERALGHGLALSASLLERATAFGLADDAGELVARQLERFRDTVTRDDRGGLGEEEIADNWEALLAAAADAEVSVDAETHRMAWDAIRGARGPDSLPPGFADVDPEALPEMDIAELVLLLDHPQVRRDAALELCRRGDAGTAERVCRAVRKMPREEVVEVAPRILALGEEAGDALIDGLAARKTFVRQAAVLCLGELRLRRAVVPLVHLLQNEPSEIWWEVARVLGSFGSRAHRALSRALKDPRASEERLAHTLAHLSHHGGQAQLDAWTRADDARVARIAMEALTLRQRARGWEAEARGTEAGAADDPVLAFSRRFYEILAQSGATGSTSGEDNEP